MSNNRYLFSKVAATIFGITTVLLFAMLRNPDGLRARGITSELLVVIVLVNFALLVASMVFFIYQRAHRDHPARMRTELLDTYADRASYDAAKIPEAITIRHEDLLRLSEPLEPIELATQDRLTPERLCVGQAVKLTSSVRPRQYVIVEVIAVNESSVIVQRTNF